jgi:hypothetical protein
MTANTSGSVVEERDEAGRVFYTTVQVGTDSESDVRAQKVQWWHGFSLLSFIS